MPLSRQGERNGASCQYDAPFRLQKLLSLPSWWNTVTLQVCRSRVSKHDDSRSRDRHEAKRIGSGNRSLIEGDVRGSTESETAHPPVRGRAIVSQMNRSDRHPKRMTPCRRWPLVFVFLLMVFTGHLNLVSAAAGQSVSPRGSVAALDPGRDPDHVIECVIDGPLVAADRGRPGLPAVNVVDAGPPELTLIGSSTNAPAVQAPPLAPSSRRALLQVFLI